VGVGKSGDSVHKVQWEEGQQEPQADGVEAEAKAQGMLPMSKRLRITIFLTSIVSTNTSNLRQEGCSTTESFLHNDVQRLRVATLEVAMWHIFRTFCACASDLKTPVD